MSVSGPLGKCPELLGQEAAPEEGDSPRRKAQKRQRRFVREMFKLVVRTNAQANANELVFANLSHDVHAPPCHNILLDP